MITATALGRLVQDGRLNLDASVQDYVPTFPVKQWPIARAGNETGVGIAWRSSVDVSGTRVIEHAGSMEGI